MRVYKFIYVSKWFVGSSLQVRLRVCCYTKTPPNLFQSQTLIAAYFIHVVLLLYSSLFVMRHLQPSSSCSTSFSPTATNNRRHTDVCVCLIYGSHVQGPADAAAAYVYHPPSCIQLFPSCLFQMPLDLSVVKSQKCPYILYKDALRCATFDKETG